MNMDMNEYGITELEGRPAKTLITTSFEIKQPRHLAEHKIINCVITTSLRITSTDNYVYVLQAM